ncbi:MAG: glycosyltransferase family 4 protein [Candidatus Rokubacteria bacterium]|nr:glycosyltransferase family 4 protein [Candidatus Rokubacteria bacterium]
MRIGIDAHILGKKKGGVETFLFQVIRQLAKIDDENEYVIYVDKRHTLKQEQLPSSFTIRVLPFTNPWFQRLLLLPYVYRSDRLDVIHTQRALPLWGCKTSVLQVCDVDYKTNPESFKGTVTWIKSYLFRRSASRSTCIATLSNASRNDIVKYYGVPGDKVFITGAAVDPSTFYVDDQAHDFRFDRYATLDGFVLFAGLLERNKNIHTLIRAFARLRARGPEFESLSLVIVGGERFETGTGYRQELRRLVEHLDLHDKVVFTGYVPWRDLRMFMNRARMVVCPSLAEGFGLPPLEAMACGTPVIASRIPAMEEVCAGAALLVDPVDVQGVAGAMEQVLTNEALSKELVRNGLGRSAQFTWEGTAAKLLDVYKTAYELGRGT